LLFEKYTLRILRSMGSFAIGKHRRAKGFTLIELSIVLVIIGLIVGGVLVGQDLMSAAAVRAQITQIEKYNSAVNTFRGKYGELPGDMDAATAAAFGFAGRGQYTGQGDGNGAIEGIFANLAGYNRTVFLAGETAMFWVDLSKADLIEGAFNTANSLTPNGITPPATAVPKYMPAATIGGGNYIVAYSLTTSGSGGWASHQINYFGLQPISFTDGNGDLTSTPTLSLSVKQAFAMDNKIDDGLPQTGRVLAQFAGTNNQFWASGTTSSATYGTAPGTAATPSSTTCYDNGGNASNLMQYSITQNNGTGANCALTFQFQ